jgi:SAM-dependent methyltransferase
MRFRNRYNINLANNPYKKNPDLLSQKNALEADWYDREAEQYFSQLGISDNLIKMDREWEQWFGEYFDRPSAKFAYDKNFCFFDYFPRQGPLRILELGSGNGALSRFLIRRRMDVVSVDVSSKACLFLAKSESRSLPLKGCAEILPFREASFDVVTSFVSLHHFNLALSLPEIWRVLKTGGLGIFIEPLCNSRFYYYLRQLIPIPDNESPGGGGLDKTELISEIDKAGFSFIIKEFEFLTRIERLRLPEGFQKYLRKIDHFLLTGIPFLKRYARVAVIRLQKPAGNRPEAASSRDS